jgi:hypothetical protein
VIHLSDPFRILDARFIRTRQKPLKHTANSFNISHLFLCSRQASPEKAFDYSEALSGKQVGYNTELDIIIFL